MNITAILGFGALISSWCNDTNFVNDAYSGASEIRVYVSLEAGYELTTSSPRGDGTNGVNIPLTVLERQVRLAVNTVNALPVGLPKLVYYGTFTSPAFVPPNNSIVLYSPHPLEFDYVCGINALACVAIPGGAPTLVAFHPTSTTTFWRTTPTYPGNTADFTGILLHEMFHSFGARHTSLSTSCDVSGPPSVTTDGTLNPISIMNTFIIGVDGEQMRTIPRDDIENIQNLWGTRVGQPREYATADASTGSWTLTTTSPTTLTSQLLTAASSAVQSLNEQRLVVSSSTSGRLIQEARRTGNGAWTNNTPDTSDLAFAFASPAIAYGNGLVMTVWPDQSDKRFNGVGTRVRLAIYPFAGGAGTVGHVRFGSQSGAILTILSPQVRLGFDDASDRFILVGVGTSTNNSKPTVYVLDDTGSIKSTTALQSDPDQAAIGKPVCDGTSGSCAIPYVSAVDDGSPLARFGLGHVAADVWVEDSITTTGLLAYLGIDHARNPAPASANGRFAVTWQRSDGYPVLYARQCISTCLPISGSAFTITQSKAPMSVGSYKYYAGNFTYIGKNTAYYLSGW